MTYEQGQRIREFAEAIMHGDDEHQSWLRDAAEAFVLGQPVPPPRGSGTKELRIAELEYENERLSLGIQAADHLLMTATGPEDGPESWSKTRQRWFDKFRQPKSPA